MGYYCFHNEPFSFLQKHDFDHFELIFFKRLSCEILFSDFVYLLLNRITFAKKSFLGHWTFIWLQEKDHYLSSSSCSLLVANVYV